MLDWRDWTKVELIIEAAKYKTKKEFKQFSNCAFVIVRKMKVFYDDSGDMKQGKI